MISLIFGTGDYYYYYWGFYKNSGYCHLPKLVTNSLVGELMTLNNLSQMKCIHYSPFYKNNFIRTVRLKFDP